MKLNFKQSLNAGLLSALIAALINAVLFFAFRAAGVLTDDIFIQPETTLTILPVLISSCMTSIVGSIVFFLFEKYTAKGFRNFLILSVIFLLLSFISPFNIPNVTTGFAVVLNLMHIVVALVLVFMISRKIKSNA